MTFKEFKNVLINLEGKPIGNLERKLIAELAAVLGWEVPNCTCHDRFQDLLIRLELYARNKNDFFKYEIARGCIIEYAGKKYSQVTCTNEIAEAYIQAYPDQTQIKVPFDDEIVTVTKHVCGKNGCKIVTKKKKRSELTDADKKILEENEKANSDGAEMV